MRMTRFGARAERNGERRRSWRNAESCQATESHRPNRCCCYCCHPLKSRLAVTTTWVVSYIACIKRGGVNKMCNPLLQCDILERKLDTYLCNRKSMSPVSERSPATPWLKPDVSLRHFGQVILSGWSCTFSKQV